MEAGGIVPLHGPLTKQLTGHLFITQQLPKQAQAALAGLRSRS